MTSETTSNDTRIVAFGASAGGLTAIKEILLHLPCDTGLAFVLVQHVGPDSILADVLTLFTRMPVHLIEDGMPVQPNHIYVNAPKIDVSLHGNVLKIRGAERGYGKPRRCIDYFMLSLAEHRRERAIGVILSGNLRDGSDGIRGIKSEFGITIAQDQSAEWKDMPRNAIETGCVDFVLAPDKIAEALARIANEEPPRLLACP